MGADGITFAVNNALTGPTSLGGAGGYLGYVGINSSFAVGFNIYDENNVFIYQNGDFSHIASYYVPGSLIDNLFHTY